MTSGNRLSLWVGLVAAVVLVLVAGPSLVSRAENRTGQENDQASDKHGNVEKPDGNAENAIPQTPVRQDAPAVPQESSAVVEQRELEERLAVLEGKAKDLRAAVRRSQGDELEVVNRQLEDVRVDYLKIISGLVDNLLRQEREELDAGALRKRLEDGLRRMIPRITQYLGDSERRVTNLRRRREEVSESELLGIEQAIGKEIEWGIVLFRGLADTVEDMEKLGMDATRFREDLTQDVVKAADRIAGRLSHEIDQGDQVRQRLAQTPDDQKLKAHLGALDLRENTTTESLSVVIRLLQRLDQPATEYQTLLLTATGEVTADVFDKEVALDLLDQALRTARDWLEQNGPNYLFRLVLFVSIVVFSRLLGNLVRRVVSRALSSDRVNTTQLLRSMAASVIGNTVFLGGILFGLSQMGIELGPVLAGLGIAGFIVGFALQDVLGNFAAGVILLSIRPYDVGDMIEAAGVFGEVSHMSLVATTILTIDHQTLVIPNGKIWGDVIKNVTFEQTRRVDMVFRVSYAADVDHVLKVLTSILHQHDKVLDDPPPMLKLHKLEENAMEFIVRPWVNTADYWETYWEVTREVKRRFDEEGINIPLPQREVRVISSGQ
jgi:small conductance mechanosensitive channel